MFHRRGLPGATRQNQTVAQTQGGIHPARGMRIGLLRRNGFRVAALESARARVREIVFCGFVGAH